jgi:hypothetical protein
MEMKIHVKNIENNEKDIQYFDNHPDDGFVQ